MRLCERTLRHPALNDLTPNSPHSKISSNINKNASGRNWEDDDANQASSSRNNNPEDALKELVRQAYGETNMEDVDFGASMPKGLVGWPVGGGHV